MAIYKVKPAQNLYDVALHLYGSIEGLFDLLITNEWLSMTTELQPGMELEYHDYFVINESVVSQMKKDDIVPSNSMRHVYLKHPDAPLMFIVNCNTLLTHVSMIVGGEGEMIIDWGDNSPLETVTLSHTNQMVEHYFDSTVETRRIKVYGTFQLTYFDNSGLGGHFYLMRPITVDEFYSKANGYSLESLFLFEGTYKVSLPSCTVASLLPIGDMSLMELDLRSTHFVIDGLVDEYLDYIVKNYGSRRNCTVYLDEMPGETGVKAIRTILGEVDWNKNGKWKFIINGQEYTL